MVEAALQLALRRGEKEEAEKSAELPLIVAARSLFSCELADGAVILDARSGVYYGLDAVGTRVWSLIQEPRSLSSILSVLLDEYDVEPNQCERDLRRLVDELAQLKLIDLKK